MPRSLGFWGIVATSVASLGAMAVIAPAGAAPTAAQAGGTHESKVAAARAAHRDDLLAGLHPRARTLVDGKLTAKLPNGNRAVLTLDPELDDFIAKLLKKNEVPYAGVVAMVPSTGKLLAYVSHSSAEPNGEDRVLDASAPAASVFKVITSTALLNEGVSASNSVCYHGGSSALTMGELTDNPKLDRACASLTGALGFSINAVIGKLALKHLTPQKLKSVATAYGFGETIPFDVPVEKSALDVPSDKLEFGRMSAGFWHSQLSPLHGAAIAATIANRGRMMRPMMVENVVSESGQVLQRGEPMAYRKVMEPLIAAQLATMMTSTVKQGTSRRTFHDGRGRSLCPGVEIAGKTGTLSRENPYRGYTWWVGFAPVENPQIALAVSIVNTPNWRIKASGVAAETMRHFFVDMKNHAAPKVAAAKVAPAKVAAPKLAAKPAAPKPAAKPARRRR